MDYDVLLSLISPPKRAYSIPAVLIAMLISKYSDQN